MNSLSTAKDINQLIKELLKEVEYECAGNFLDFSIMFKNGWTIKKQWINSFSVIRVINSRGGYERFDFDDISIVNWFRISRALKRSEKAKRRAKIKSLVRLDSGQKRRTSTPPPAKK